jgi:hypothetical protein
MRLISWTLRSGSEQIWCSDFGLFFKIQFVNGIMDREWDARTKILYTFP